MSFMNLLQWKLEDERMRWVPTRSGPDLGELRKGELREVPAEKEDERCLLYFFPAACKEEC